VHTLLSALAIVTACSLAAWIWLVAFQATFWRIDPRLGPDPSAPARAGTVVAVVPARDEEAVLPMTLPSLVAQVDGGLSKVIVVNDGSTDRTAEILAAVAASRGPDQPDLVIVDGEPLPPGWAGKVWAVHQGVAQAGEPAADYLLLTDADILHPPGSLRALVARAQAEDLDLVSVMARLRCSSRAERLLVPAFVYFFAKLYPFRRIGRVGARTAAAAGGCMLVKPAALAAAGGFPAIRAAMIDDVALAKAIKRRGRAGGGRIWLGFSDGVASVRAYPALTDVWKMVARSAFTQLGYSYLAVAGTVVGMILLYGAAVVAIPAGFVGLLAGQESLGSILLGLGVTTVAIMAGSYVPMMRYYGQPRRAALSLPVAAALYTLMTVDSARQYWRGGGGTWKGRSGRVTPAAPRSPS